jgi:RNA polymerase sigma-70 factor (ECF subfamily)
MGFLNFLSSMLNCPPLLAHSGRGDVVFHVARKRAWHMTVDQISNPQIGTSDWDQLESPLANITKQTLGDVLYAKAKALVSEHDWVILVQSIAVGDQLALHALYDMAHRIVFTLTMRITGNRESAEELTVDVFHDVWRHAPRFDPANGTVLAWIMNQARSRAIDRLRFESRRKRSSKGDLPPQTETAPDPHAVLELQEEGGSLRAALAVLTPEERQAIETTFFAGLTHAEAAARLNQPLGTVKTRIRSGLHKLRHALAAEARGRDGLA